MSMFRRLSRLFNGEAPKTTNAFTSSLATEVEAPRASTFNYSDERIPQAAKAKAEQILRSIKEVEIAMEREQVPSFKRVNIHQMRDHHLPQLLQSYIDVPAAHRTEIFRKTGKSASFLLNNSLDKLQERVDTILRDLAQHDIDAFTNHTQFIDERYSNNENNPFG